MRLGLAIAASALFVLGATGCEQAKKMVEQVAKQAETAVDSATDTYKEAMGLYAKGYNEIIGNVPDLIDSYGREIPFESEPGEGMDRVMLIGGVGVDMALKTAQDSFAQAKSTAPDKLKHFAAPADELLTAARGLASVYSEVQKYYQAEDYKDDKYAKGKELHTKFKSAADAYYKAVRTLEADLTAAEDVMMAEELAKHSDKATYGYQWRAVHAQAKKTLNAIERDGATQDEIAKAVDAFTATCGELKTFADGKADLHPSFKAFVDTADRYLACLKRMRRAGEELPPKKEVMSQELSNASDAYNNIVGLVNALSQVEQAGQLN